MNRFPRFLESSVSGVTPFYQNTAALFYRHVDVGNALPVFVRLLSLLQSFKPELMKFDLPQNLKGL
jgi:hypothetical protein